MNKKFNGKAIYQPAGKAAEYAKWACNFYVGCSNACTYCYCKRFNWGDKPKLKACFKDEEHALEMFEKELKANLPETPNYAEFKTPQQAFAALFDNINGCGTWDSNPYVFCYSFKLIK